MNWLHKLLNPHCIDCKESKRVESICPTCEALREVLNRNSYEKDKLLETIQKIAVKPEVEHRVATGEFKPVSPTRVPISVMRRNLEEASRLKAEESRKATQLTRDKKKEMGIDKEIEKLDKEVGVA